VSPNILGLRVCEIFPKEPKMISFARLVLKKGHETQFLNNFLINLTKNDFWCVAKILLIQKCVTSQKSLEDTALNDVLYYKKIIPIHFGTYSIVWTIYE
jgi:hypothetical protein